MTIDSLLEIAATNALLATGLALCVWCVTRFARNPHVAHLLWCVVLLKLVTPPLVAIPIGMPAEQHAANSPRTAALPAPRAAAIPRRENPPIVEQPRRSPPLVVDDIEPAPKPAPIPPVPAAEPDPPREVSASPVPPARGPSPMVDWQAWLAWLPAGLLAIWFTGSAAVAFVILLRMFSFNRELRRMTTIDEDLNRLARCVAEKIGLRHVPEARLVSAAVGPLVWAGRWRPVVIVPAGLWRSVGPLERETLLAHEFAHLVRRDHWIRRGEVALIVLFWWLPTLWWAIRRREAAAEACCDALVLRTYPDARAGYADALLYALELSSANSPVLLSQGLGRTTHLKARLTMIVKNHAPRKLGWTAWLLLMGLSAGLLGLSAEFVSAQEEGEGKSDKSAGSSENENRDQDQDKVSSDGESKLHQKQLEALIEEPQPREKHEEGKSSTAAGEMGAFGGAYGGGYGAGAGEPAMPGGAYGAAGMFGMPPAGDYGAAGMMPGEPGPAISAEVRQKMLDRLMAIALDEEEPLTVRLSAMEAATSAGMPIESGAVGEKLEGMLWKAFRESENLQTLGRLIQVLSKYKFAPPTAEDAKRLVVADVKINLAGPDVNRSTMNLLQNLTNSADDLSQLIAAAKLCRIDEADLVTIPKLEGLSYKEAMDALRERGFKTIGFGRGSVNPNIEKEAVVTKQTPPAGTPWTRDEAIRVVFSKKGEAKRAGKRNDDSEELIAPPNREREMLLSVLAEAAPRDDASVKVLLKALDHKAPDIRAAAISALGNLRKEGFGKGAMMPGRWPAGSGMWYSGDEGREGDSNGGAAPAEYEEEERDTENEKNGPSY